MPTLTVMCGLPGVGKTTLAHALASNGVQVITSDEYRRFITGSYGDSSHDGLVQAVCRLVTRDYLACGRDVIFDATNPTLEDRLPWITLAKELGAHAVCIWVVTSEPERVSRNLHRENVVPDWVVDAISKRFVPPSTGEGFEKVIEHTG